MELSYVLFSDQPKLVENFKYLIPDSASFETGGIDGLGAVDEEGSPCGVLVFDINMGICMVDWIFVPEEYRRRGIGGQLLETLLTLINENKMDVDVEISYLVKGEETTGLDDFMLFLCSNPRFFIRQINPYVTVTADECRNSVLYSKLLTTKVTSKVVPFFETASVMQRSFLHNMEEEGRYVVKNYKLWRSLLVEDLCFCCMDEKGISACIFMKKLPNDGMTLDFMYGKNRQHLINVMLKTVQTKAKICPEEPVSAVLMNELSEEIFRKVFENHGEIQNVVFDIGLRQDAENQDELSEQ